MERATNWTIWNALAQWITEGHERTVTFSEKDGQFICSIAFDFCSMEGFGDSLDKAAAAALGILQQEQANGKGKAQ